MRLVVALVLCVACSDDDKVRRLPDAPPPPDGSVDAATTGPVSLTIFEGTTPRVGIRVVFQNADSSVVSDTTTGTDGKASAVMDAGGYVTAFDPFPGRAQGVQQTDLRTFAGVKPGDQLRLFERSLEATSVDVTVTLPVDGQAFEYRVSTNCLFGAPVGGGGGSGGPPSSTIQMAGCGPTSNLLVESLDSTTAPIGYIYKPSVSVTNNAMIDLSSESYAAIPDATFAYTNVPSTFSNVGVYTMRATALGVIKDFATATDVTAGAATITTKLPPITGATAATLSTFYGAGFTQHIVGEWGPATASYALDPSPLLLPDFGGAATLDVPAHEVTWTATGGAVQPDLVRVRAFLNRDTGGSTLFWRWEIVAPGGTRAVLPVLPSSPYNPVAGDFGAFDVATAKVPGGYDAVRANILAAEGLHDITVGATGKASFALLVEPSAFTSARASR